MSRVIILSGPAGAGKTTSVVAASRQADVQADFIVEPDIAAPADGAPTEEFHEFELAMIAARSTALASSRSSLIVMDRSLWGTVTSSCHYTEAFII